MNIQSISPKNQNLYKIKLKNNHNSDSKKFLESEFNTKFQTPINHEFLTSKFDISFKSSQISRKNSDCAKKIQKKIETQIKPQSKIPPKSAITSPDDIETLNKIFKKDNIGSIFNSGISLNRALIYLAKKKQIQLKGINKAFFIDEYSLEFLKDKNYFPDKNTKFYCFENSKEKALDLISEFREIPTLKNSKIEIIQKSKSKKIANYPRSDVILKNIEEFAKYKFPNDPGNQERTIQISLKYLNKSLFCFSYQKICAQLRDLHNLIEKETKARNLTMDDVIYLIPEDCKSYDLINYLYAKENNIAQDKFKSFNEILDNYKENKVYVIIDDLVSSGSTVMNYARKIIDKDNPQKKVIFAPLVCAQLPDYYERELDEMREFLDVQFLPLNKYENLSNAAAKYLRKKAYGEAEEFNKISFKNLDSKDIAFLCNNIQSGCGLGYSCVNFPYMIPDNSTEINTILGEYFLNHDSLEANRGINDDYRGIRHEDYKNIKGNIGHLDCT